MRIGIITLPPNYNYGGILQAWALQETLQTMGHEVSVMVPNRPYRINLKRLPMQILKRAWKRYIKGNKSVHLLTERYANKHLGFACQYTEPFMRQYLHRVFYDEPSDLKKDDFDAFVVGSDQVWRPLYYKNISNAYLDFAKDWKDIRRVTYAASFGTDRWSYTNRQTKECRRLAQMFDLVTVRENSGVKLCKDYLGVEATHVLDPTMLVARSEYERLVDCAGVPKHEGDVFMYILDNSAEILCKCNSFVTNRLGGGELYSTFLPAVNEEGICDGVSGPVEVWLRAFMDAKFVITDSFHACVFSIIFNKPFICIGNKERGMARVQSLLEMFGLGNHLCADIAALDEIPQTDWNKVNQRRQELIGQSQSLLRNALS